VAVPTPYEIGKQFQKDPATLPEAFLILSRGATKSKCPSDYATQPRFTQMDFDSQPFSSNHRINSANNTLRYLRGGLCLILSKIMEMRPIDEVHVPDRGCCAHVTLVNLQLTVANSNTNLGGNELASENKRSVAKHRSYLSGSDPRFPLVDITPKSLFA
jgi:hypothetical protein